MIFLRWLGSIVLIFWLIGLILRIGGSLINLLLLIAALVFVVDVILERKKSM
ncbi:DUF5670 family protein [Clostridium sp. JN-9]|uniref:DUF5670 family protein n=1 Tax=Clostridium sp. JN-9 TaxID=2507159 RepID=UPI0013E8EEF9|nr:DUF5670 family protein [Clostridium sp. JN-9]